MAKIISIVEWLEHPIGRRMSHSVRLRNVDELAQGRGTGRICAKVLSCLALAAVILLLSFIAALHMLRNLSAQPISVRRAAMPADISALFGSRWR